jgi:hypothetical protein
MENKLPVEIVKEIEQKAKSSAANFNYHPGSSETEDIEAAYVTGATEWAQWKVQYDELKERADKMAKEHSDLNLALAAMLNGYQNLSMYQKDWFTVPKDLIDAYTKMVIEYDNQGKEVENGL